MDTKGFIEAYWRAVANQDAELMAEFLCPDVVVRWHNTNEAFDRAGFIRANCDYPGHWQGEIERFEAFGNLLVTVVRVWDEPGNSFHVCSFFRLKEGKIHSLDEYWGDDGEVPSWRKTLNLSKPIQQMPS